MLKKLLAAALTAALMPAAAVAATNAYPTKPVRFVVPYPAGGPLDTVARAIGDKLRDSLGQPVVVENKPGAGGNLGADYVAKQPADGYTIVMGAVATHLSGELFKSMAKISMVHIPYNGASPAQLSVLSGQTDLIFDNLASASANIKAGKLKAFAVTTAGRAAAFPELPTIAEAGKGLGLEGFDISTWFGVFAPANTPREIVEKLNHEIVAILKTDDMKARLARIGAQPAPTTPEQFGALVQKELKKYAQIVKVSGAKVD
ncbi:Tripartite tricarboxylate transporter family receptor [compost metagenome]